MAAHMDRFKILVVGDCGVGKTSFVHGVVHQCPLQNPSSTIGCSVEVLPYNVPAGRASGREVFLEFWDVGGSTGTRNSRSIFYSNADGLIVVHDLSNRKSFLNLQDWVQEALNSARQEFTGITVASPTPSPSSSMNSSTTGLSNSQDWRNGAMDYDNRDFDGSTTTTSDPGSANRRVINSPNTSAVTTTTTIPVLVLGTKEDQCNEPATSNKQRHARHIGLTDDSDVIFCAMNCLQEGQLASHSNKWTSLHAFFQKVVENRYNGGSYASGGGAGRSLKMQTGGGLVSDSGITGSGGAGGDFYRARKKIF